MSIFDLNKQNSKIDTKIAAGLERLSQVFKSLLWQKATAHQLSPIQIQLLIFINYHDADKNNISYLADEFNISKPTVSDAIKLLEQKELIIKTVSELDARRYSISLTKKGKNVVRDTEDYTDPIASWITRMDQTEKESLWTSVSDMIMAMNAKGIISAQRTCHSCRHYNSSNGLHFCSLLGKSLDTSEIRIDCGEYEAG